MYVSAIREPFIHFERRADLFWRLDKNTLTCSRSLDLSEPSDSSCRRVFSDPCSFAHSVANNTVVCLVFKDDSVSVLVLDNKKRIPNEKCKVQN